MTIDEVDALPGSVITERGFHTVSVVAEDAAGNRGSTSVLFEIRDMPYYGAVAVVDSLEYTPNPDGTVRVSATVLLASQEFAARGINLSTVTMRAVTDEGIWLHSRPITIAGAYRAGDSEYHWRDVQGRFQNGYWRLNFHDVITPSLAGPPDAVRLFGMGLCGTPGSFDYLTYADATPSPDPIKAMKGLGVLQGGEPEWILNDPVDDIGDEVDDTIDDLPGPEDCPQCNVKITPFLSPDDYHVESDNRACLVGNSPRTARVEATATSSGHIGVKGTAKDNCDNPAEAEEATASSNTGRFEYELCPTNCCQNCTMFFNAKPTFHIRVQVLGTGGTGSASASGSIEVDAPCDSKTASGSKSTTGAPQEERPIKELACSHTCNGQTIITTQCDGSVSANGNPNIPAGAMIATSLIDEATPDYTARVECEGIVQTPHNVD